MERYQCHATISRRGSHINLISALNSAFSILLLMEKIISMRNANVICSLLVKDINSSTKGRMAAWIIILYIVDKCQATDAAFHLEFVVSIHAVLVRPTYSENRNNSIDKAKYTIVQFTYVHYLRALNASDSWGTKIILFFFSADEHRNAVICSQVTKVSFRNV